MGTILIVILILVLVGIVSLGDVGTATGDEQLSGEILEQMSEPP